MQNIIFHMKLINQLHMQLARHCGMLERYFTRIGQTCKRFLETIDQSGARDPTVEGCTYIPQIQHKSVYVKYFVHTNYNW